MGLSAPSGDPRCLFDGCRLCAYAIMGGICPCGHVSIQPLCREHLRLWEEFLAGHPLSWVCGCGQAMIEIMTEVCL